MRLNELKTKAQDKINALKELFESQDNDCDGLDLTRSAYPVELGTRHPLTIVKNEIIDIFARLGFSLSLIHIYPHQVKAEAVNMIFFYPIKNGLYHELTHHRPFTCCFIATP